MICNKKQLYFFSSFMEYEFMVEKSLCKGTRDIQVKPGLLILQV